MEKLVSIIIPCFNKEKWLEQAINSCLNQTYSNIEIIVIDDGSTDNSLEIIKSYGTQIIWETGKNRGANYARNRGFVLSRGAYIQYLDADDYILPKKIEEQVKFLQSTEADAVYSDWQQRKHLKDGTVTMGKVQICGPQEDFLELTLSYNQWIQTANPLFNRATIANSEGWDESLQGVQDVDFFRSLAISKFKFVYLPGCYTVYRQYGSKNRISSNKINGWNYRILVAEKTEKKLIQNNLFLDKYQKLIARLYFQIAIFGCCYFNYLSFLKIIQKSQELYPAFYPEKSLFKSGYLVYKLGYDSLGFTIAGIVYKLIKDLLAWFKNPYFFWKIIKLRG